MLLEYFYFVIVFVEYFLFCIYKVFGNILFDSSIMNNVEIQVPCSETVVALMDLEVRPTVQQSSFSKLQSFTPPFLSVRPLLRNQNSQPLASQIRLHSPLISSDFPSSTVQNSALVPSNSSTTHHSIVSAGQNASAGSTSNALSKRGIESLKITIPVPARKVKTIVPVSYISLWKVFILIISIYFISNVPWNLNVNVWIIWHLAVLH